MNILRKAPKSFDGYHCKIDIHLGKEDGLLCSVGSRFILNRHDNPIHGLPNLNCEDAGTFKGSIFCEQEASVRGVGRNIGGDIAKKQGSGIKKPAN